MMATTRKQITPTGFVSTIRWAGVPVTTPRLRHLLRQNSRPKDMAKRYGEKDAEHGLVCHAPRRILSRDLAPSWGAVGCSGAVALRARRRSPHQLRSHQARP